MNNGDRDDIRIWTQKDVDPSDETWQDLLGIYSEVLQNEVVTPPAITYDIVPPNIGTCNVQNAGDYKRVPQKVHSLVELMGVGNNLDDPQMLHANQDFDGYNQMIRNSRLSLSYQPSYNLNSPPRSEGGASSTAAKPLKLGPTTPEQQRQIKNHQIIRLPHLAIEEISTQENDKWDDVVVLPQQLEFVEKVHNTLGTSSGATPKDKQDFDHGEIDLNKMPPEKTPKRRKHRPKVVIEGKPERTPKPKTTPPDENRTIKRKSMRKKGINTFMNQASDATNEFEESNQISKVESCKRVLNFDLENVFEKKNKGAELEHRAVNNEGSKVYFNLNVELNEQSGSPAKQLHQENLNDFVHSVDNISTQESLHLEATAPTTTSKDHTLNVIARSLNVGNAYKNQSKYTEVHNRIGGGLAQLVIRANTTERNLQTISQICSYGISETSRHNEESQKLRKNGSESSEPEKVEDRKSFHTQNYGTINITDEINKVSRYWNTNPTDSIYGMTSHDVPKFSQGIKIIDSSACVSAKRQAARQTSSKKMSEVKGVLDDNTTSMVLVDYITDRMKDLRMDNNCSALVPYRADGAIVPYEAFDPIKKRRTRPKVDLDPETNRLWNLLMGKEGNESAETTDSDKQERWEEERKVFRGRVDSFISQMHLVQGDRRFSKWKGSVVDSVIGVFLTQNVSDHLSSSAFLSLAAKFPIKSTNTMETCGRNRGNPSIGHDILITFPDGTSYNHRMIEDPTYENSVVTSESFTFDASEDIRSSSASNFDRIRREEDPLNSFYLFKETGCPSISYQQSENAYPYPFTTDVPPSMIQMPSNGKKRKADKQKAEPFDWDTLRKEIEANSETRGRSMHTMDSLDYEAVRNADVREISEAIKERGMNNMLAERIKDFLNRLIRDHGEVNLEWLRNVQPDKVKDYLLSIRGLGLKSVECVRLLTLHHLAFPVDTNVGRIAVRLGWVPLQPLPESLQLHLLELYPVLESIQKYLWPRLCMLDQETLYELHYQMITFGKVFCTKREPNCNACPLRAQCRHFASAFASARLALPSPEESRIVSSSSSRIPNRSPFLDINPLPLPPPENLHGQRNCEPIIEEPTTPELDTEVLETDIEDAFYEDPDEIPVININIQEFTTNLQNIIEENKDLHEGDMSKALVALSPHLASIPVPKLKHVSRLRTEHQVYELPDSHPLLRGLDMREQDDPSPYLLAIWTPGETADSIQPPQSKCSAHEGGLCNNETCFSCNNAREARAQIVRGTILIPCRTATRGSFPLNGTYFQVNEVFADHETSMNPTNVPRSSIWNLPRRKVFFGTSVSTIFKGMSTDDIQQCFWRGFICVRGFDRKTRAPRPLMARLHLPASKTPKKNE